MVCFLSRKNKSWMCILLHYMDVLRITNIINGDYIVGFFHVLLGPVPDRRIPSFNSQPINEQSIRFSC